ncbi:MAG: hypothetical protein HFJ41_00400 [Clostridia bacterium]|nr:hypothetical protein [Clostridia bacterium]
MKEKLIAFTRNEEKTKRVKNIDFIITILIITMQLFIFQNSTIALILLFGVFLIETAICQLIKSLSKEREEVIRNNKIGLLFLSNTGGVLCIMAFIFTLITGSIFISLKNARVSELVISSPQLIICRIIFIIYLGIMCFLAYKISNCFRKMLK